MEGQGSSDLDLAGMILQCREDVSRIESELSERKADLAAMERVQRLKACKNGSAKKEQSVRVTVKEMAEYLSERIVSKGIPSITPKEAVELIRDAPFLNGLAYKSKHVYVTRALQYKPVFRAGMTRGLYLPDETPPAEDAGPVVSLLQSPSNG